MKRCMGWFRKNEHDRFCGLDESELREVMSHLMDIQDSVELTTGEEHAMSVAVQAVSDIRRAMMGDGKIHWELHQKQR